MSEKNFRLRLFLLALLIAFTHYSHVMRFERIDRRLSQFESRVMEALDAK